MTTPSSVMVPVSSQWFRPSEAERVELLEHLGHPRANDVTLLFQRQKLRGDAVARDTKTGRIGLVDGAWVFPGCGIQP